MCTRIKNVYAPRRLLVHLMKTGAKQSGANHRTSPANNRKRPRELPRPSRAFYVPLSSTPPPRAVVRGHLIQTKRVLRVALVTHTSALH
ncbi:unnamed protein product, partial [Iphiclides podalirius]